MNARPIVFLGPSLSRIAAEEILDADYRPPIRSYDLDGITKPGTIVIIDGQFGASITLALSEALRAIDRELVLVGAASTGAMLAARFPKRMTGLGWVFKAFLDGRIRSADDISVLYRPDTLAPLTIPVVSVLCWLERLVRAGRIEVSVAREAAAVVRELPLPRRDIDSIHDSLSTIFGASAFDNLLAASGGAIRNVKAADAILALQSVSEGLRLPRQ